MREKGIDTKPPKDSLKEAFRIGWIKEEEIFVQMLEDRNKTSHIYAEQTSKEIFQRIKKEYLDSIEEVLTSLRKSLAQN